MNKAGLCEQMYLVVDIGTSYIKCACVDSQNNIAAQFEREFPMEQNGRSFEIDFELFFDLTNDLLTECLSHRDTQCSRIEALLITSQAQTFAAVDADFLPLHRGIVWLDERAEKEAVYLKEQLPDFSLTAGFNSPLPALYVSKLLWLKKNEPTVFDKAKAFPLINEFLIYRLSGEFYTDSTGFGMSGMFDFRRNTVNSDLLQILGLAGEAFPEVTKAAFKGAMITEQIQRKWQLDYRFPVFLCGNDQGASACGAGIKQPGDVTINFGTATVFYTITRTLTSGLSENQIAGKHPIGDDYFLLNWESDFGIQIRWLKHRFFQYQTYDQLFQTWYDYSDAEAQCPPGNETDANSVTPANSGQFCAGIIKFYLNRLKAHFGQIRDAGPVNNIFVSGGMTQSKVWLGILNKSLNQPFTVNNSADAGLFGAIDIYLHSKSRRSDVD